MKKLLALLLCAALLVPFGTLCVSAEAPTINDAFADGENSLIVFVTGIGQSRSYLFDDSYLAEDAFASAKFYDSRQRTAHAALAAWEEFLRAHPDSPHAEEARARIEVLKERIEAIMKGESK